MRIKSLAALTFAVVCVCLVPRSTAVRLGPQQTPYQNKATELKLDAFWQRARQEVYRSTGELLEQRKRELRRGNPTPIVSSGDRRQKVIALTFDDGPHPEYTPRLLEILKKAKVPATFFVIGHMVERNPQLARDILEAGHEIGNHSFSHVTLTKIPVADVRTEYRACNEMLIRATGKPARYCRPPGGDYDEDVVKAGVAEGLSTVLWTDDPGDFLSPGTATIEQRTMRKLKPGAIILLHDGVAQTLAVLPQILQYAKAQGYRFVPISKLPLPGRADSHERGK